MDVSQAAGSPSATPFLDVLQNRRRALQADLAALECGSLQLGERVTAGTALNHVVRAAVSTPTVEPQIACPSDSVGRALLLRAREIFQGTSRRCLGLRSGHGDASSCPTLIPSHANSSACGTRPKFGDEREVGKLRGLGAPRHNHGAADAAEEGDVGGGEAILEED